MKIAYIAYRYPTLTQTFIQREVQALTEAGIEVEVHAMRDQKIPSDFTMPVGATLHSLRWSALLGLILYLPWELLRNPRLWIKGLTLMSGKPWRGWDNVWINLLGVVFALLKASEFRQKKIVHFHGVWATGMTTAAALLARMTGGTYSMGAHAFDIYRRGGDFFLSEKLKRATFVHTTTVAAQNYLQTLAPEARVILSRRGLLSLPDLNRKIPPPEGSSLRLLSVGRLVPKKGFDYQLLVIRELKRRGFKGVHRVIGEGELGEVLRQRIQEWNLGDHVHFLGSKKPEEVQQFYAETDLFWHSGLIDPLGDRDGLPNVVPEAMAWRIPVLSSPTPGVDEAVIHQETGWIADPVDIQACADAIQLLEREVDLRMRLGQSGREWVEKNFLSHRNVQILVQEFQRVNGLV